MERKRIPCKPLRDKATEKGTFFKTKSVPFSMQQRKDAK
jgi:2-methylaconitate cis-trans-isomerase PrpF